MVPPLNSQGLLPAGIHLCDLAELEAVFGFTAARIQLIAALKSCIPLMQAHGLAGDLLIAGSFVTDKEVPDDIEVTLDVRNYQRVDQDKALLFYMRQHAKLKAETRIDWYPTMPDNESDFTLFFQYVGEKTAAIKRCDPKDLKGILKLTSW